MCFSSGPRMSSPTPPPPPVDTADENSAEGRKAAALRAKQAALSRGYGSTIMTGPQGDLTPAPVQKKQLLGS